MADISSNPVVDWGGMVSGANLQQAQAGQAQANTSVLQQQAQQQAMQTQVQRARLPLIMQAISDYTDTTDQGGAAPGTGGTAGGAAGAAPGSPDEAATGGDSGVDPNTNWYDPAQIKSTLRSNYFVQPVTAQEAQRISKASFLDPDGSLGLLNQAKAQRQLRIDAQTGSSQYNAGNMYDAMSSVANAGPSRAMAQLAAVAPGTVAKIKAQFANDPDEARDEDAAARAYASEVAGNVHMYTGREVTARADGTYVDKNTGQPVPGVEKSGLSEEQWSNLAKSGMSLVDYDDGQGHKVKIPTWQANKAPDLGSWIMQMASHAGIMSAQPTIGGAPKAQARASAAQGIATAQAQTNTTNAVANAPVPGTTVTNGQADPNMSAFLGDPSFKYKPPVQPFGTSLSPDEQKDKDNQVAARQQLKQTADAGLPAAQQALTFYKAAQDVLDTGQVNTGKWGTVFSKAAQWMPGVQITAATNYQEAAKYLANAALLAGKGIFPKMTQKEGDWIMNKLNPSPEMNETAIRNMVANGQRMSQYTIDSTQRVGAYLQTGGDATRFNAANAKYFPEPEYVTGKSNPPGTKYTPAQIQAWATAHKVDLAKAQQFFGAK